MIDRAEEKGFGFGMKSLDYLQIADKVSKILEDQNERVVFSNNVVKINRKGAKQRRVLVITNKALYNVNKGMFFDRLHCSKGAMRLEKIKSVAIDTESGQSIIKVVDGYQGYDYHYYSECVEEVGDLLQELFEDEMGKKRTLTVTKLEPSDLESCRYSIDRISLQEMQGINPSGSRKKRLSKEKRLSTSSRGSRGSHCSDTIFENFNGHGEAAAGLLDLPEEALLCLFAQSGMREAAMLMCAHPRLRAIGKKVSRYWGACKNCGCPILNKKEDLAYKNYLEILGHDGRLICTRWLPDGIKLGKEFLFLRDLDQNALILFGGYYRKMYNEDIDFEKFDEFFDEHVLRQCFCKGCGLYLGFKIDTSQISCDGRERVKQESCPIDADLLNPKDMDSLCRLYQHLERYSQNFYFAESYMRWFDEEKEVAQWKFLDSSEIRCRSIVPYGNRLQPCNALLGSSKDVVCKAYHTHDIGNGEELMLYVSKVQTQNLELGNRQATYLSVGPMYWRDMKCRACGATVGLKYEKFMVLSNDWRPRNVTYNGRYGLVKSTVMDENEDLPGVTDLAAEFQLLCRRKGLDYSTMKSDVDFWTSQIPAIEEEEEAPEAEKDSPSQSTRPSYARLSGSFSASFSGDRSSYLRMLSQGD